MSEKSGLALRIVAGLYLIYLGVKIILQVYQEQPGNLAFMVAVSILFILVGAGYALSCIKKIWKFSKGNRNEGPDGLRMIDAEERKREEDSKKKE